MCSFENEYTISVVLSRTEMKYFGHLLLTYYIPHEDMINLFYIDRSVPWQIVYSLINFNTCMLFCCHHCMLNRFSYHVYCIIVHIPPKQIKNIDIIVFYTFMYLTLPISLSVYISSYRSNKRVLTYTYSLFTVSPVDSYEKCFALLCDEI